MDIKNVASGVDTSIVSAQSKRAGNVPPSSSTQVNKAAAPKEKAPVKENKPTSPQEAQKASQKLQDSMNARGSIDFSVDEATGESVVKVVDAKTKEVLMQMPSKTALAIAQSLKEGNKANLVSDKA
jgi:flagellar protein FlaG